MSEATSQAGVRQALYDLQRYLSDQLAPMMVTDAVELLVQCPPQIVAKEIHGWVDAQFRGPNAELTVSDCIYHAMKKLHMMMEFDLIAKEMLEGYLQSLVSIVVEFVPESDRELLRDSLGRLGEGESATASPVSVLHRHGGREKPAGAGSGAAGGSVDIARGMRQFSVLIERLTRNASTGAGSTGPVKVNEDIARHALATAAVGARNDAEFQSRVQQLTTVGIDGSMERILRALGRGLPEWAMPVPGGAEGAAASLPPSLSAAALHKILAMAEDPEEGAQRFNEMMNAAIEQFNEGRLVQAATMLDLADRIASEKKLDAEIVKNMRGRAHESLAPEQLRKFAERPEKHPVLRKVLGFFTALTPEGLLSGLYNEQRRDRRKLLLALLEVHGAPARKLAFERVETAGSDGMADPEGYLLRNLVFLLRRIPRPADAPLDAEINLLAALSALDRPPLVIKEALAALGSIDHPRAERTLMVRLVELEKGAAGEHPTAMTSGEVVALIDRAVSALTQLRTTNAYRTVVTHALKREPRLGDTMGRLDELADHDLSSDKELVARIVKILEQELPTKVLGFIVKKNESGVVHLIRGLSGTPSPVVRQALEDIVDRFPGREIAEAATKALAGFGVAARRGAEPPSKTMTGDVELFGLPNLFQTLADSQVTGVLTLADPEGDAAGVLSFASGKITGCQVRALRGESALYQLFEKPVVGTFTFTTQASSSPGPEQELAPMEVLPVILEAMRRHDEFNQARALVPDDLALRAGDAKPQPLADEHDIELTRAVWSKASAGVTPETCESLLQVDSYRIRRLYAHWLENRALQPR